MKRLTMGILVMFLILLQMTPKTEAVTITGSITDIGGHWAQGDIEKACAQGLMSGVGEGAQGTRIFQPDMYLSRAELALTLVKIFKLDMGETKYVQQPLASDYYLDVNNSEWYARAVVLCEVNTVFPSAKYFRPDEPASRMEVAQAIYNCYVLRKISLPAIPNSVSFEDAVDLSPDQIQALAFLSSKGIMNGYENHFRPQESLSRAEMAVILNRSFSILEDCEKIWLSRVSTSIAA